MIELAIVIVILGALATMGLPRVARELRRTRVNQAAVTVAADIENAFTVAARQRRPVTMAYVPSSKELQVADRATSTVLRRRALGRGTEWNIEQVAASGLPVTIFPSGVASGPFSIDLTTGGFTRRVSSTRVGLTRVSTP